MGGGGGGRLVVGVGDGVSEFFFTMNPKKNFFCVCVWGGG